MLPFLGYVAAHDFSNVGGIVAISFSGEARCSPQPLVVVVVVVNSFLFVLGTNGRMQPVVMAPKNLSTKH